MTLDAALAGPIRLPPIGDTAQVRDSFAATLYGAVPPPPDNVHVTRKPIPGATAQHLAITTTVGPRRLRVDAGLWSPVQSDKPAPLICGLDFAGPVGILSGDAFPLDPDARVYARPEYGVTDGRMTDTLRGSSATRWPVDLLCDAGFAVMVSCYGSWVPDDPAHWQTHGVYPLTDGGDTGAVSLWAWGISRMVDAAAQCDNIDTETMIVAGHSRLGKAALWAAANDPRITGVFANQSGCAGAAPAAHPVGETLAQLTATYPHWVLPDAAPAHDQHQLLALIAPRALYLAGAKDDLWADPLGSFAALHAAASCWDVAHDHAWQPLEQIWHNCGDVRAGPLGFHLRAGAHDLTAHDWRKFLQFMARNP